MDNLFQSILDQVCGDGCKVDPQVLEQVIVLAVEIAREGREGRKIGTIFVVGDTDEVMRRSRTMILDPLFGHPDDVKRLDDADMRETVKELAQLDGGFVISEQGTVLSAARYFDTTSEGIRLKLGLGSRHLAAASISRSTRAVAVVVSESSVVRVFHRGALVSEIIPELWMLRRMGFPVEDERLNRFISEVTIVDQETGGL